MKATKHLVAGLFLFLAIMCGVATGAYLEAGGDQEKVAAPDHPRKLIENPDPAGPVRTLVRSLSVGRPVKYRNLTVFPLETVSSRSQGIRTLSEALNSRWISIEEQENPRVSEISVRNKSKYYVLLMAGEIITGGKQNRIIRHDVLLPPRSAALSIPVYCGEKERWDDGRAGFKSSDQLAGKAVRMAVGTASQDTVWREIDGAIEKADVRAPTRDYEAIYGDKKVKKQVDRCVASLKHFCRRDTVGAVVVAENRVVSCDIFADPALLRKMWTKICRSYALEALDTSDVIERHYVPVSTDDISRFVKRLLSADATSKTTPGVGASMSFAGSLSGEALTWRQGVVHGAFFPTVTVLKRPKPVDPEPIYRTEDKLWR